MPPVRRLYRCPRRRICGGVARGVAIHLGISAWVVRALFVVLTAAQGMGVLLYVVLWVVVPVQPAADRASRGRAAISALVSGVMAVAVGLGLWQWSRSTHTLVLGFAGVVLVGAALTWQRTDPQQREQRLSSSLTFPWLGIASDQRRSITLLRWCAGGVLVLIGLAGLLIISGEFTAPRSGVIFGVTMLAGLAIVLGPWLARVLAALRQERYARIRSQERAEVAAIVHDKVMHTLALIQRRAGDPREVSRIARGQERELRSWLYGTPAAADQQFGAAVHAVAAEAEDAYAVTVETVVVGDIGLDEPTHALVAATREALLNAAKHAEVNKISLYAEVDAGADTEGISVYVRDRGVGFELATVPADRHGVHHSIIERMRRYGGTARLRTAPGQGTEVRLHLPRGGGGVSE